MAPIECHFPSHRLQSSSCPNTNWAPEDDIGRWNIENNNVVLVAGKKTFILVPFPVGSRNTAANQKKCGSKTGTCNNFIWIHLVWPRHQLVHCALGERQRGQSRGVWQTFLAPSICCVHTPLVQEARHSRDWSYTVRHQQSAMLVGKVNTGAQVLTCTVSTHTVILLGGNWVELHFAGKSLCKIVWKK